MDETQTPKSAFEETIESLKAKAASARTPGGIVVSITDLTDPTLTHHVISADEDNPEGTISYASYAEDIDEERGAIGVIYDPERLWKSTPYEEPGLYIVQTLSEIESAVSYMLDHPEAFRKEDENDLLSLVFGPF